VKKTFTLSMDWLHTWCGLVFGWVLFSIFLTGAISVFTHEITYWSIPEVHGPRRFDRVQAIRTAETFLSAHALDSRLWTITLPNARDPWLNVAWRDANDRTQSRNLYPDSGELIPRETNGGWMYFDYHYALHLDPVSQPLGIWIVGAAAIAMLCACISGIVVHKRIFKDFFTFRPKAPGQRSWLDAHNVLAVLPLPFHILIAYTGLIVTYWTYMPAGARVLYGGEKPFRDDVMFEQYRGLDFAEPGASVPMRPLGPVVARAEEDFGASSTDFVVVRDPGRTNTAIEVWRKRDDWIAQQAYRMAFDGTTGQPVRVLTERAPVLRVQSIATALHFVWIGGSALRWLYFLCGLAGAGTIAVGLVLFTVKRRAKQGALTSFRMVESLNVAAIAGPTIACAAYLWGVRLLPVDIPDRMDWEVRVFFWTWLAALIHAGLRPARQAWKEQLSATAVLFVGVPLLGVLVPSSDLMWTISHQDWVTAAVDLTSVALGLLVGSAAWRLREERKVTDTLVPAMSE
jgi:uncharacterized iron-regulated membrane protein